MIKLGEQVTDSVTGFSGKVMARSEYLYGCVQVLVQPEGLKDGQPHESQWFDEQRLTTESQAKVGGPQKLPPS